MGPEKTGDSSLSSLGHQRPLTSPPPASLVDSRYFSPSHWTPICPGEFRNNRGPTSLTVVYASALDFMDGHSRLSPVPVVLTHVSPLYGYTDALSSRFHRRTCAWVWNHLKHSLEASPHHLLRIVTCRTFRVAKGRPVKSLVAHTKHWTVKFLPIHSPHP